MHNIAFEKQLSSLLLTSVHLSPPATSVSLSQYEVELLPVIEQYESDVTQTQNPDWSQSSNQRLAGCGHCEMPGWCRQPCRNYPQLKDNPDMMRESEHDKLQITICDFAEQPVYYSIQHLFMAYLGCHQSSPVQGQRKLLVSWTRSGYGLWLPSKGKNTYISYRVCEA